MSKKIEGFTVKCNKCGSGKIKATVDDQTHPIYSYAGGGIHVYLECEKCKNEFKVR